MTRPRSTRPDPDADRSGGGPGSSHQGGAHGHAHRARDGQAAPEPGEPTNPPRSRVSGGGGERDRHHVHDEQAKR